MKYLSLFSGISGGDLALQHYHNFECLGYLDFSKYCVKIIEQRIKDGLLSDAPIFHCDIRRFIKEGYAGLYSGVVDAISAGPPCQPSSTAGKKLGEADRRNMWPQTIECIRIIRPREVYLENVSGLLQDSYYYGKILGDLASSGYITGWKMLSCAELDGSHKRDRVWIVANLTGTG